MKLEKLTLVNFMSVRRAEIDLANQGLVLIQGQNLDDPAFDSNGAGKSTIFEGLCYALFDKTVRGLSGNEVVNRNIGKNCLSQLDFRDDDGTPYRISRYRAHNEHKNHVYIFKDGVNITPKSTKDANALIEELFQFDYATFTNSILFGQGLVKMFSVATDAEKKAILEKMLQIDMFKKCQEVAKRRLAAKKTEAEKVERDLTRTADLITEVERTIASLEEAELEEKARAKEEAERLTEELKKAQKELAEFKSSVDPEALENLNQLRDRIDAKLKEFKEVEDALKDLKADLAINVREIKRKRQEIEELTAESEKIAAGVGTACPACGQPISQESVVDSLRHVMKKIAILKQEVANLEETQAELLGDAEKLEKHLSKKAKYEEQRNVVSGEISEIAASIRAEASLRKAMERRVSDLEDSIARVREKAGKTYQPLIAEKQKQRDELILKKEELSKEQAVLSTEMEQLSFWVDAFGNAGIKSYLLDSVTPFLNKRANYYLSKLAGNTTQIEFSTQTRLATGELRDKFEVRILNSVGGDSYESNSTGERRRIDLAISLALQDLVMTRSKGRLNVLLYDEIFDGLDAIGCENAILLLQEMQKSVESIFVITHNDILKSYFDRFLIVTKENGETKVRKEG